jgi:hypothetical protein
MVEKRKRGLYFIAGMVPTDAERAEAAAFGLTAFRNASQVTSDGSLERAEFVAGLVPERYKDVPGCRVLQAPKPAPEPTEENTRPEAKPDRGKAGR